MVPDASRFSLILASGGVESSTLMALAARQGDWLLPVFLDYGQRAAPRERLAALAQSHRHGTDLEVLDMAGVAEVFHAGQERLFHVPLPHRNLVALSLALSLGEKRGADRILLGVTREDAGVSATATPEFLAHFRTMADGLGSVTVEAPLQELDKAAVIRKGGELGVDFGTTYSCLLGYVTPCGRCPQCEKRADAFAAAGRADPPFHLD